jgi:hypothetical protein
MLAREELACRADRHLLDVRAGMPPRLREAYDGLVASRGLLTTYGGRGLGVLGHPVYELPLWLADRLGDDGQPVPEEVLGVVLGVSALGYLHVRAQDDWLDGADQADVTPVALAEALLASATRLLASLGPSERFWRCYGEVLSGYAGCLVRTSDVRGTAEPVSRPVFEELLDQSSPLVLPSAVLLDRAGRWDLLGPLQEFVRTATGTSQVVNDLADLHVDLTGGRRTWSLDAVGPLEDLWVELVDGPSGSGRRIEERVDVALELHERCSRAAAALELRSAGTWLSARRRRLERLVPDLRAALVAGFVQRLTWPSPAPLPEPTHP